jgi:hypothetical protein
MKTRNTIISNIVVALMFLFGAGAAHALDVILDDNDFVVEIRDLEVVHQNETTHFYDVKFEAGSAYDVYGDDLVFDFGVEEENAALAIIASWIAINGEAPVPMRAGADGADQFFAGTLFNEGVVETFGAEYYLFPPGQNSVPNTWDECDRDEQTLGQRECIQGVLVIPPSQAVTWALFTPAGTADTPELSLMPTELVPATLLGEDAGDQQFTVTNWGSGTLDYTITDDQTWLSVSPSSGTSDGEMDTITVRYTTAGLELGVHNATITVSDPDASNHPQTVEVMLFVTEEPAIGLSATVLMPETVLGNDALSDTFTVTNVGGLFLIFDVSVDAPWLSVDPEDGISVVTPDTITVSYATSSLAEGVHEATITVSDPGAVNNPQAIAVVLTITGAGSFGTTEVRQTSKVDTIPGIIFGVGQPYEKPAFPFVLPQSSISGSSLFHADGWFSFSSPQTDTTYSYGDWTFELLSTCAADGDPCLVQTDNGTPWALRNVDFVARTARMVFTDTGAQAFSDLAGATSPVQVFASSQRAKGDFGGLAAADAFCTNAAASLGGDWTAWLSDSNTNAIDRIPAGEYRLLDGTLIANSLTELTSGTLLAPIDLDENSASFSGNPWTGTQPDGIGTGDNCDDWTDAADGVNGTQGQFPSTTTTWTQLGSTAPCAYQRSFYCFSAPAFHAEETFADVSFIPEPSTTLLQGTALFALIVLAMRRRN